MTKEQKQGLLKDLSSIEVMLDRWSQILSQDTTISFWICRILPEVSAKISVCKEIVNKVTATL